MRGRGKQLTQSEKDVIFLLHMQGLSIRQIAARMGRGKSGIAKHIKAIEARAAGVQAVLDMGQADADE